MTFSKIQESTKVLNDYWQQIQSTAEMFNLPALRIAAMVVNESSGIPLKVGLIGERGLMQITPGALADVNTNFHYGLSWEDMFNPEKNILAGSAYLKLKVNEFSGDLNKGTQAYNAGAAGVRRNPMAGLEYLNRILKVENTINHLLTTQER